MNTSFRTATLPLALALLLGGCQRGVEVLSGGSQVTPGSVPQQVVVSTPSSVPAGTTVGATLNERLSTAESRVGESFAMTLQTSILNQQREVLIPQGAQLTGRVTALRESIDVATPAIIRLELQSISWAGRTRPLQAEIVRADPTTRGRGTDDAIRGAAGGAAAGAVLGAVLSGDVRGALTGAAIGAGAGTVISLGITDQTAMLDAGSEITLRLTEPIQVPR